MMTRNAAGIGLTLLAVAGALSWATPDTAPADPAGPVIDRPLSAMLLDLEERASEFEQRKDVKCWTSFRQLETFVAGRQLTPATTHLKTEVVINYLDQVWKAASDLAAGTTIEAEEFARAAADAFPSEIAGILDYTLRLGGLTLTIPYHDFDNYLNTIEPIRVVQTLALRVADRDPDRRPTRRTETVP